MFFAAVWGMPVATSVILFLLLVISFKILGDSLKPEPEHRGLVRRLPQFLTGFFGLSYVGIELLLYGTEGLLHSRTAALTLFVIGRIMGCAFFVMAIPIAFPRSMQVLLPISAAIGFSLNIFAFWFETRYRTRLMLSADGTGLFLGGLLGWLFFRLDSLKQHSQTLSTDST